MENPHTFEELKEHMGLPPWFTEAMLYPGVPIEIPAEDNTTVILSEGTIREAWPGAWSGTPDPKHTDVSLRPIRWQWQAHSPYRSPCSCWRSRIASISCPMAARPSCCLSSAR